MAADFKGWNIKPFLLNGFEEGPWISDDFIEIANGTCGIYLYQITEYRMCSYACLLAIFNNKKESKPVFNLATNWISYQFDQTFTYAPLSNCIIFRSLATAQNAIWDAPFLIVNLDNWKMAYIAWDHTSIFYRVKEHKADVLAIEFKESASMENYRNKSLEQNSIQLESLEWFDAKDFHKMKASLK